MEFPYSLWVLWVRAQACRGQRTPGVPDLSSFLLSPVPPRAHLQRYNITLSTVVGVNYKFDPNEIWANY
jgi:hypothetical protein